MSVFPRCTCDPIEAMVGNYAPTCNRHGNATTPLQLPRVTQLAYIMCFLDELGFDLETVKRAADAWWAMKSGATAPTAGAQHD